MTNISAQARASLYAEAGGFSLPVLLEITHGVAGYPNPLRLVNNTVSMEFSGQTFLAFPFKYDPPTLGNDGAVSNARLSISAIDQTIAAVLRSTMTPPTVTAVATYWSDETGAPVFEELVRWDFILRNVSGNVDTISGELVYEERMANEFPTLEFSPASFPGVF